MVSALVVVAAVVIGAVVGALVHRLATELDRESVVVCNDRTREWDAGRGAWVHRTRPLEQLRAVLVGRRRPAQGGGGNR